LPIEQLSNAIAFYGMFYASKQGKTGLTVTVDVLEITQAGVVTEIVTGAGATEIGKGLYRYQLASGSVDAAGEYIAVFKTTDATVDMQHIPAIWVVGRAGIEALDAAVSTRAAEADYTAGRAAKLDNLDAAVSSVGFGAAGEVSYLGPVAPSGDVTIVRGDSYLEVDGRALEWATAQAGTWPDLTAATIKVTFGTTTFTGSVVVATGITKRVRLELTAAQSNSLARGRYDYDVEAILGSGAVVTLTLGEAVVLAGTTP
jgi:hypothetical protein